MGLISRVKAVWYALLNKSVSDLEDKHVIPLAEATLQQATERLKEARQGLVSYQALVYKVENQVENQKARIVKLTAQIKTHLNAGQEEIAGELVMEMNQVKDDLVSNEDQLSQHREAYENNLLKMKSALKEIQGARQELQKKKAALQMETALAEVAETAGALNTEFDASTDLSQIMSRVDDQIHKAKARTKVTSDLSTQNVDRLKAEQEAEKFHAKEMLAQFKIEQGLAEAPSTPAQKTMGEKIEN